MNLEPAPLTARLERHLPAWLPSQRWYGAAERKMDALHVVELDVWETGGERLGLAWIVVEVTFEEGEAARFQIYVGARPVADVAPFIHGREDHVIAEADDDGGYVLYDALLDPELAILIERTIAPEVEVATMRPLAVEATNTSVVFDERYILKLFRRVHPGPNPDAEVTEALARVGFSHVVPPLARHRRDDSDLAVVREFLPAGADGLALALTSLRDLYTSRRPPAECGGDFAPEARRLGEMTAQLHAALAEAFGAEPADADSWVDALLAQLQRVGGDVLDLRRLEAAFAKLRTAEDLGSQIRVHGDLHLAQALRTDAGWYILDFEGEPARPVEERRRAASPLVDVAGMIRSFDYAAQLAVAEHGDGDDPELALLAEAWTERNTRAFVDGYSSVPEAATLLPQSAFARDALLTVFELGKAVYEVGYELSHRPALVDIPLGAVRRLLEG